MLYLKFFEGISLIQTPLPLLSCMSFLVGMMSILMGLLAEIMVRTYFESQGKPHLPRARADQFRPASRNGRYS